MLEHIESVHLCEKPIQLPINREQKFCSNNKWENSKGYAEFIKGHKNSRLRKCSTKQLEDRYNKACSGYVVERVLPIHALNEE